MGFFVTGASDTQGAYSPPRDDRKLAERIKEICNEPVSIDVDKMVRSVMDEKEKERDMATTPLTNQDHFLGKPQRSPPNQDPFFNSGEDEMAEFERSLLG